MTKQQRLRGASSSSSSGAVVGSRGAPRARRVQKISLFKTNEITLLDVLASNGHRLCKQELQKITDALNRAGLEAATVWQFLEKHIPAKTKNFLDTLDLSIVEDAREAWNGGRNPNLRRITEIFGRRHNICRQFKQIPGCALDIYSNDRKKIIEEHKLRLQRIHTCRGCSTNCELMVGSQVSIVKGSIKKDARYQGDEWHGKKMFSSYKGTLKAWCNGCVGKLDLLISVCESEAPNGRSVKAGRNNAPVKRFANARGKFKISSHSALSAVGSKRKQASISSSSRNTDVDYVLFKEVMKNKKAKQECEQSRRDAIKVGLDKLKELTREFVDSAHRVSRRGPTEKQTLKIVLVRLRLAKGLPPFPPNLLIEDSNFRAMPASFITPGCRVTENGFQIPKGGFAKDKRGVQRMENKQRGERRRRNVQRLENELVKMCVPENMQASLNKKGILNCIAHSMTVLPPPKPSERLRIQAIIKKSNVVIPKHMGQPIPLLDEKNRASPAIATENILQAFYDF